MSEQNTQRDRYQQQQLTIGHQSRPSQHANGHQVHHSLLQQSPMHRQAAVQSERLQHHHQEERSCESVEQQSTVERTSAVGTSKDPPRTQSMSQTNIKQISHGTARWENDARCHEVSNEVVVKSKSEQEPDGRLHRRRTNLMDIDELRSFERTLAHTMRVENLVVHCGHSSAVAHVGVNENPATLPEMVSYICANWKKQVDALALTPVEQVDFYRRQYDQLLNVLSVSLFNRPFTKLDQTTSHVALSMSPGPDGDTSVAQKKQIRKRNATPSSDCELIVFKNETNNKFMYRSVNTADKYAKRSKITKYLRVVANKNEQNDETRNVFAALRSNDPSFVVGSEIRFDRDSSLVELLQELKKRFGELSLENQPTIEFVCCEDDEDDEPQAKRKKTEKAKVNVDGQQTTSRPAKSPQSIKAKVKNSVDTRPSGVEMDTDTEEENEHQEEKKKVEDDDNSDSGSDSSSSESSDDEERSDAGYVPTSNRGDVPSSDVQYVPTPKIVNKSYFDELPPSPLLADVNPNVVVKKKKRVN